MNERDFIISIVKNEERANIQKVTQFNIKSLEYATQENSQNDDLIFNLPKLGVWGKKDFPYLNKDFVFLLSFKPSRFHLGYLPLLKQINFWSKRGAHIFCLLGVEEAIKEGKNTQNIEENIKKCKKIINNFFPISSITFINDHENKDFQKFKLLISNQLILSRVKTMLGWDDSFSLADYNIATQMVTSFLFPQLHLNKSIQTIIPCGLNEIPFIELSKIIAKKLKLTPPSITSSLMLKDIKGKNRMNSTNPHSIYLDQEKNQIEALLYKTVTGGRSSVEQRQHGGDIENCLFAKYSFLIKNDLIHRVISSCQAGINCRSCKDGHIPEIIKSIATFSGETQ